MIKYEIRNESNGQSFIVEDDYLYAKQVYKDAQKKYGIYSVSLHGCIFTRCGTGLASGILDIPMSKEYEDKINESRKQNAGDRYTSIRRSFYNFRKLLLEYEKQFG